MDHPGIKNLKPFPPGVSGNPGGRPKSLLSKATVQAAIGRLWDMPRDQVQAIADDPKCAMGEGVVAAIMLKAMKDGDASRFSLLLDRAIGRVKGEDESSTPAWAEAFNALIESGVTIDAIVNHLGKRTA